MHNLRSALSVLVGEFQWRPPGWLRGPLRLAWRRRRALGILLLATMAVAGVRLWLESRPQPVTVEVQVSAPGVTPIARKLVPQPLRIRFAESVAPLNLDGRDAAPGIRLEPTMSGRWAWESDRVLRFDSAADWPAATKYRVTIDPKALAMHVRLASHRLDWKTPEFAAKIGEIEFYQDPRDPSVKQVVATVEFSHRVEADTLARQAGFLMLGRNTREDFDVTFDEHHRTAYLRTKPVVLPEREDFVKLTVLPGVRTAQGGAAMREPVEAKVRVPDVYSFFRFSGATAGIAWTDAGDPEQIVTLTSTCAAESRAIGKALSIRLLPKKTPHDPAWGGPREVTSEAIATGREVEFEVVASRDPQTKEHAFRIRTPEAGQLYVRVDRGVRAPGDFVLGSAYDAVVAVPKPAPSVTFEGDGAVLALAGERKLSVRSRGLPAIDYEIARVATSQINHLVSQTSGDFANPEFRTWTFDEENISRIATERQSLPNATPFLESFSALDLAPRLALPADGGSERGLFFLTARGWNPKTDSAIDGARDSRFLLVTDLGLIVKTNADGGREVFVASIDSGLPLLAVDVRIVGKNGVPVARGRTDADGRAAFSPLSGAERDRQPVAIVAELNGDVSFLPYERRDRGVDFSRFDVGGDEVRSGAELDAFLFTERGVYRPGDTIHVGYIVKRRDWASPPAGLPLEIEVTDARGQVVATKRVAVSADGFGEFECATTPASATGMYSASLYLLRDNDRVGLLGRTMPWVKEFLPDRMKIAARIEPAAGAGWLSPTDVRAIVSLRNLYGTAAPGRKIAACLDLTPGGFAFTEYPGYRFDDPIRRKWTAADLRSIELPDRTTDADGAAVIDLDLERFEAATYAMTLSIEGFEGGGGRSVGTQKTFLVSPLPHVVGCRTNGDLEYLPVGTARNLDFLAVNRELKSVAVDGLNFRLVERVSLSALGRQPNGNYAYESVEQEREVAREVRDLPVGGLAFELPTASPGSFRLEVFDGSGAKVSGVEFRVVGKGDGSRELERNAELEIRLPRREFRAGEEIEVAITAPYTGSGLITLERDRAYAHSWFVADATSSVQRLRIPEDFEGTGYVNVAFVRGLDSAEVFASPLSCAVEPITVNRELRRVGISLDVAERARPGEPLAIRYRTDRPARIVVFAVDEGILQVSDYRLPQPLDHFFRKTALMVGTSQIMDLILPEFSVLRSVSASGGDGEMIAQNLNPFRRVTEKPVVFWSGILDSGTNEREVRYDVPDYFDGTLRVMAVAYASEGVGSTECATLVRGRFVITPGVPTVVAPGDEFEIGVTVANGGDADDVKLEVEPSGHLAIVGPDPEPLRLAKDEERTVRFRVKAKNALGSAELVFRARGSDDESRRRSTLSVRPATPYRTNVRSARFSSATFDMAAPDHPRPEFRTMEATVSALPLGLARGLQRYLEEYPFGCSEQVTSGALCRLMLSDHSDFGMDRALVASQIEHTFGVLRQRQNDQGGFGYWSVGSTETFDFISVYVSQLLIEAKSAGFPPPPDMLAAATRNLSRMAAEATPRSLDEARIQAWAIYLLTREEAVTTNAIVNLRDTLESRFESDWRSDLTAVYLAGALELMKQDGEARKLVAGYRCGRPGDGGFSDGLANDARYVAVLARHFPELLRRMGVGEFEKVLAPIERGRFNTLSAALAVVALKSYSETLASDGVRLGISAIDAHGRVSALPAEGGLLKRSEYGAETGTLRFSASATPLGAFCQTVESGFTAHSPESPQASGLEIFREFPKTARVGEPVTVTLRVRSVNGRRLENVAIVDLLPGGFEVVGASIQPGVGALPGWDYVDVREDRVLIFGTVGPSVRTIEYQIKPVSAGRFAVPPAFAESMYDRGIHAHGIAEIVEVSER